jgi:hypothetical protein
MIANQRWLVPLGIVAVLVLALAWWRPWQVDTPKTPRPVALVPTRTPTAARATVLVPFATARPQPSAPPPSARLATPAVSTPVAATPQPRAATPTANIVTAGTLYFLGSVDGRNGVVAANADGSGQRLLVPGIFGTLAVAPNGASFAVIGPIADVGGAYQLAVLTAGGRALARYPFGHGTQGALTWSPSGQYLLGSFLSTDNGQSSHLETWVYGDDGAQQIAPPDATITFPYGWTPDDRIAFLAGENPARPRERTLWTTDATGGDARIVYRGPFIPIDWNQDGTLLYALAYTRPDDQDAALDRLIEIELPFGIVRDLAGADTLAAGALGVPNLPGTYRFDLALPSPDGRLFAIGVARQFGPGTPAPRAGIRVAAIIFMRTDGLITGTVKLPPGETRGAVSWSPDSSRFALLVPGVREGDGQILALDTTGKELAAFTIERTSAGLILPQIAWSRDGEWLAYTGNTGLSIAAATPDANVLVVPGGTQPVWRP